MELLAPAGNFEKLKIAVNYGADAVYFAGSNFGLRAGAENFTLDEIQKATIYTRQHKVKSYLLLNIFPLASDISRLPDFLNTVKDLPIDAVICSDLGVVSMVKKLTSFNIHLSTQASITNFEQALVYKDLGIKRLILAREVSIKEAYAIKQKAGIEVELFIHGAMCSAISGHCVLSNYQNGRDSNRGGCIQNCRHSYELSTSNKNLGKLAIGAKDLLGIELLKDFVSFGIDSAKIEGRMKSPLYLATIVKSYRQCLDNLLANRDTSYADIQEELKSLHHRDYHTGFLEDRASHTSMSNYVNESNKIYAGIVISYDKKSGEALLLTANKLTPTSQIEFILPESRKNLALKLENIYGLNQSTMSAVKSGRVIRIKTAQPGIKSGVVARIIQA